MTTPASLQRAKAQAQTVATKTGAAGRPGWGSLADGADPGLNQSDETADITNSGRAARVGL